uniref:Protein kinase domain-containing protein n=1 Tax=Oryza meridionalis TaxID=40149 RepID=A0A0E0EVI5_9ORYZ
MSVRLPHATLASPVRFGLHARVGPTCQPHAINTLLGTSSSIRNKFTNPNPETSRTQPNSPPINSPMAAAIIGGGGGGWTRLRSIGHGASGATVSLAADDASGELFVVKSAGDDAVATARQQLRREWSVMSGLSSPHVLRCLGFVQAAAAAGEHQLFLEYAPGGSLADVVARNGDHLDESAVRAYAADVLRGLDYLHGKLVVHGDVKGSNVLVGADGRAKLADFGCARVAMPGGSKQPVLGGTPAFMAPEVARGEEQGPAADVWALGCTVVEMATGRAPWSDMDNVLAALQKIGYTDAVPDLPPWLSPEAKDFLRRCLQRRAGDRPTAAQLLQHPFVSKSCCLNKEVVKATWVSPTSALDAAAALWESETSSSTDDEEDDDMSNSPTGRIRAMASSGGQTLPDWDSDDHGWIEVLDSVSISVANKTTAAVEDYEASESPAKRVRAMVCSPSSVPDWDSDNHGWIDVLSASPANDNGGAGNVPEEFDVVAAADQIFGEAVDSIVVGLGSEQSVVVENQEDEFISLSSCSESVLLVVVHAADDNAASRKAGIKECSHDPRPSIPTNDVSGELFVVKSAAGEGAARQQLRREWSVMSGLSSPHVLKCLGFVQAAGGEHQLFLEYAPGGSLADVVARNGGRLDEGAVRAYAADVLRGIDYLHGKLVVHGDVKGSNVLVGADGRAKLADFGCARVAMPGGSKQPVLGGTPAFMAPEVARGEEQGPAADVWALGCTVVEMATGRAPWSDMDNVLAALHKIGYTDMPRWLSPEAKDFLRRCLQRRAGDRPTAAQLLQHPFISKSCGLNNKEVVKATWVSPTSALDAALWESESSSTDDEEDDDMSNSPTGRIREMAYFGQTLPDWDSDDHGCSWIEVLDSVSINVANKAAARVRSKACSLSSVPDWDSDVGWIDVLSSVSISIANKLQTATAADNESSECPTKRVKARACSPSSVPDWDSDQGWIHVLCASPADDNVGADAPEDQFDVAVAADQIFAKLWVALL